MKKERKENIINKKATIIHDCLYGIKYTIKDLEEMERQSNIIDDEYLGLSIIVKQLVSRIDHEIKGIMRLTDHTI